MSDFPNLKNLEEQRKALHDSIFELEKSKQVSSEIANLKAKKNQLQQDVNKNLNYGKSIGAVERLGRALSAFSTTNSTYVASKAAMSGNYGALDIASIQGRQYLQDVLANIKSAATGTDYRRTISKEGKDLLTDIFGMKPGAKTTMKGIAYDIMLGDPSAAVTAGAGAGLKTFNTLFQATNKFSSLASKIPQIQKGMDYFGRTFNLFHDVERSGINPDKITEFKDAFRLMASVRDNSGLKALGTQMPLAAGQRTNPAWAQRMTNIGYRPGPGSLKDTWFPKEQADVLFEAFGDQHVYTNPFAKTVDWTNKKIKSVLAWNPKWQTRNILDAVTKNTAEGVSMMDYIRGFILQATKGKIDPSMGEWRTAKGAISEVSWDDLVRAGVTQSTGPMDAAATSIVGKITNFFETTFARVAPTLKKLRTGEVKSVNEAAQAMEKIHYNYAREFLTGKEKILNDLVFPYWKYEKGQIQYWPQSFLRKQRTWGGLYHAQQNTLDPTYAENPELRPGWMNFFMSGNSGNYGFSMEDFVKTYSGTVDSLQNIAGKVSTIPKMVVEGLTDWSFFNSSSISGNVYGKRYRNAGPLLKDFVGYDEYTGNVENTRLRWMLESLAGVVVNPYLDYRNAMKGEKPWSELFFSQRPYDFSTAELEAMQARDAGGEKFTGGVFGQLASMLSRNLHLSTGPNQASASNPVPVDVVKVDGKKVSDGKITSRQDFQAIEDKRNRQDWAAYVKKIYGVDADPDAAYWNASFNTGNDTKTRRYFDAINQIKTDEMSANIAWKFGEVSAEHYSAAFQKQLDTDLKKMKVQGATDEKLAQYEKDKMEEAKLLAPRKGYFFSEDNIDLKVLGYSAYGQGYNKFKEDLAQFVSKTSKIFEQLGDKDFIENIVRRAEAEKQGAILAGKASSGQMDKAVAKRLEAIDYVTQQEIERTMRKTERSILDYMENSIKDMDESFEKLEFQKQIEEKRFFSSDDARNIRANSGEEAYWKAFEGIDQKYQNLRLKLQAKNAAALADLIEKSGKDELDATVKALRSIFDRGGMTITEFYEKMVAEQLKYVRNSGMASVNEFIAQIRTTTMKQSFGDDPNGAMEWAINFKSKSGKELTAADLDQTFKYKDRMLASIKGARSYEEAAAMIAELHKDLSAKGEMPQDLWFDIVGDVKQVSSFIIDESEEMLKLKEKLTTLTQEYAKGGTEEQQISALESISSVMDEILKLAADTTGNVDGLASAKKEFAGLFEGLKGFITQMKDSTLEAQQKLAEAIRELRNASATQVMGTSKMLNPAYEEYGGVGGLLSTLFGKKKIYGAGFGMPSTYDYDEQDRQRRREDLMMKQAKDYSQGIATFGLGVLAEGFKPYTGKTPEDAQKYLDDIEAEIMAIQTSDERKLELQKKYHDQLENLDMLHQQKRAEMNGLEIQMDQEKWNKRFGIAQTMTGNLLELTTLLYEQSGRKSKEAFYAMKAVAIADAIIKGAQAVMSAYAQGGVYAGPALAAIAAAMTGAQISIILSQDIGKAEGGLIEGGSGMKDDVPILAMGGEYVVRKDAVNKYGKGMLEAINRGLFDPGDSVFSMPDIPINRTGLYAEGGVVSGRSRIAEEANITNSLTILNVVDPSELDRYLSSAQGQNAVLNVLSSNPQRARKVLVS